MRCLFGMGVQNIPETSRLFVRNSARAIIIRDGRIAMIRSSKYSYCKFPGGGIEKGESPLEALIRETKEESGLTIIPSSVREYGCVHRCQPSVHPDEDYFVQDNFYYLCDTHESIVSQVLDAYELEEGFVLEWMKPEDAVRLNRTMDHLNVDKVMVERESRVLELLLEEGYFAV